MILTGDHRNLGRWEVGVVLAATFLTGAAGLVYQVIWQRYLARLLGAEATATAVILGVFLGGLALGYFLCGQLSARLRNPLLGYAMLEGVIGVWGAAFPWLYQWVFHLTEKWSFQPPFLLVGQGVFSALILLALPTVCMGGTVPLLTRGLSQSLREATRIHAWVYAVNTGGAFVGTLLAGFFLLPSLGLAGSGYLAAALNLVIGGLFYFLSGRIVPPPADRTEVGQKGSASGQSPVPEEDSAAAIDDQAKVSPKKSGLQSFHLLAIAFISGFYVMGMENVLIRFINITLGSSSYSFSLIVAVFILSIAIGAAWVGRLRHIRPQLLFFNQASVLILLLIVFLTLDKWPYFGHVIRVSFQSHLLGFWLFHLTLLLTLLAVLVWPVALMGATVPLAFHELKRELSKVGLHSGLLLSFNGLGALSGSLLGGVVLFHFFDLATVYLLLSLLVAVSAIIAAHPFSSRYLAAALTLLLLCVLLLLVQPSYHENRFALGTFRLRTPLESTFKGPSAFYDALYAPRRVLYFKTGPTVTVAVVETQLREENPRAKLALMVNGRSESDAGGHDRLTTVLSAHYPALFARSRKDVLVIGMGTGVTAGELTLYPDIERIAVAEISSAVRGALPHFAEYTHRLHENPRFQYLHGVGLRILRRMEQRWDIVISEPSNPFVTGVDQLFNREFYALVRSRLKPGGVLLQWLQAYSTTADIFSMILNALRSEFENVYIYIGSPNDLLVMATDEPFGKRDRERITAMLKSNTGVRNSLKSLSIPDTEALLKRIEPSLIIIADDHRGAGIETEDRPRIHYLLGKTLFTGGGMAADVKKYRAMPRTAELKTRYATNWSLEKPVPIFPGSVGIGDSD